MNPSHPAYAIGVDIGGTRIKCGTFNAATGELLSQEMHPTEDGLVVAGNPAWAVKIREFIHTTESSHGPAEAVGIAAPGLAAAGNESIIFMPGRLAGLEGLNWSDFIGRHISVLNDAHAALLGETWCGAAAGLRDVVMLTLGTGVGGAILSGGSLLQGSIGRAGHLGHMTVHADGPRTIAGMPGGLDWAIGHATVAERSGGRFTDTAALAEAVASGDNGAIDVWERSIYLLSCGIGSLINVIDPAMILLGGGIAELGELLFEPVRRHLETIEWRPGGVCVPIQPAQLGEWAGAYGAANFALKQRSLKLI